MKRIGIAGGPNTGKTTLAGRLGGDVLHTDSVLELGWSECSEHVATEWLTREGELVVEGVALVRALRKWLEANPAGRPIDRLLVLTEEYGETLSKGQAAMTKGHNTVLGKILPDLRARGVDVSYGSAASFEGMVDVSQ